MNIGTNRNLQSCTKSKEIYPTSEQSDVSPTISYLKSQLYQLFNIPRWRAFHHTLSSQTSLTRRLRKPFPHCQCAPRLQTRSQIFNTGTQKHCLQKGSLSTVVVPGILTRHVFTWNGRPHKQRPTTEDCVQREGTQPLYWGYYSANP